MDELRRVTGFLSHTWLRSMFGVFGRRPSVLMAPDLLIEIEDGARRREYEIVGSYVLRRRGSRAPYQFYFALLLFEWMGQQTPPTP